MILLYIYNIAIVLTYNKILLVINEQKRKKKKLYIFYRCLKYDLKIKI